MHVAKTLHCEVVVECTLRRGRRRERGGGCIIALVTLAPAISAFAQPQSGEVGHRGEQRIKTKKKTKTKT